MEVEMKIRGLMMDPVTNMPIVILKDAGGETVLPIWVGVYEANAIALEIEKVSTPRPMTHDLIKNVLTGLEAQVHKVVVTELEDTFYAVIWLEREGQAISIDSRPSDALALALRVDCPIFVDDEVLKTSKKATTTAERSRAKSWKVARGPRRRRPRTIQDVRRQESRELWLILPSSCSEFISPVLNFKHRTLREVRGSSTRRMRRSACSWRGWNAGSGHTGMANGRSHGRAGGTRRRQVFQAKDEIVEATTERLEKLRGFAGNSRSCWRRQILALDALSYKMK